MLSCKKKFCNFATVFLACVSFFMKRIIVHRVVQFKKNHILKGNVATAFRCAEKFNDGFVAIFQVYQ